MKTRPLENFGVEVSGIDLARNHDPATVDALRVTAAVDAFRAADGA